jgi:hypothetical protein
MKRDPILAEWDHTPDSVTYRCSWCRRLVRGTLGLEGSRHEECGTGHLTTIARVSRAMLVAHETAGLLDELRSA